MAGSSYALEYPPDSRPVFGGDEVTRRIARVAQISPGAKVGILGASAPSQVLILAKEFGCSLIAVDPDPLACDALRASVKAHNVADRVEVFAQPFEGLPFQDGELDALFLDPRVPMSFAGALAGLRRHLSGMGKLCIIYPARVGRIPNAAVVELWEKKLDEALLLPREMLQALEKAGYEPQAVETLGDADLDDFYRALDAQLARLPASDAAHQALKRETDLHRQQGGKSSVSFALVIARRKEPGEKPPPSRSDG